MRNRDDHRSVIKHIALLMTIAACVLIVCLVFLSFCMIEALVLSFTGGAFSMAFPAIATVVVLLALVALAIVGGGSE